MRKRLQEIGGHCEIQSEGGRGTQITFIVPAKKNNAINIFHAARRGVVLS
jgi:signal transduction histidine kinase